MTTRRITIERMNAVQVIGLKGGREKVIAIISRRDGRIAVDSDEGEVKRALLDMIYPSEEKVERVRRIVGDEETERNKAGGWPAQLRIAIEEDGLIQELSIPQRRDDSYYLEALCGPRKLRISDYERIWIRSAGDTWEEEIEV